MSVRHPLGIYAAYLRMIDETIAEAESLQSSAVLDQLRQRWTEKLQERLRQAPSTSTALSHASASSETAHTLPTVAKHPQPCNQDPVTPSPTTTAFYNPTTQHPDIPREQTTSSAAAASSLPSRLTSEASSNISSLDADLARNQDAPTDTTDHSTPAAQGNDDDEGWDSTEWEAVPSTPSASETTGDQALGDTPNTSTDTANMAQKPSLTEPSTPTHRRSQSPSFKSIHAANAISSCAPQEPDAYSTDSIQSTLKPSATRPRQALPERRGEGGRGVIVESQSELYDDEEDINTDDLSDLEDDDPECSDLIVSQFEHVQRPHARKPAFKGLWRIKLRHGIVQIGGHELLFHTLAGDLTF